MVPPTEPFLSFFHSKWRKLTRIPSGKIPVLFRAGEWQPTMAIKNIDKSLS